MSLDQARPNRFTFPVSLVIGCLVIGAAFLTAPEEHMVRYFSSDTLYLPSLYRDLFADGGSLLDWSLNPAPNFFPDMGLFFVLNALFGSFLVAAYVYPMVQFVIIACLFRAILRACGRTGPDLEASIGALSLSLLAMCTLAGGDFDFAANFLLNSYHLGAFVNALLASWLLLRLLSGASFWWAALLVLVIIAASISDRLFWVIFLMPATGTLLFIMTRPYARMRHMLILALMIGAAWVSYRSLLQLAEATELNIEQPYALLSFDRIRHSWDRLLYTLGVFLSGPLLSRLLVLVMFVVCCSSLWMGFRALRAWVGTSPGDLVTFASRTLVLFAFPIVLLVPVLNGSFDGVDSIRYNYSVFVLALLLTGPLLATAIGRRSMIAWSGSAVIIASTALFLAFTDGRHLTEALHYQPPRVKAIDRLALRHGLKNGVAEYWDAKTMTMFSSTGLKVLPVFDEMSLYLHVNRIGMFYRSHPRSEGPIEFEFVVLHTEEQKQQVPDILGRGCTLVQEGPVEVLLTTPFRYSTETRGPIPGPQ